MRVLRTGCDAWQLLIAHSASITSVIRLKYVVKYSNSFDSTWDNVDVIKWSLIEILAACICGNLLPLRPLIEQLMPPFRSIYSWYSDRRSSHKSSEKASFGIRSFGRFARSGASNKPRLISTLHFTQMSLSPIPTPDWDRKNSTNSDSITVVSPRTPTPAYLEKIIGNVEEEYVQEVPHGMMRKTATTHLRSQRSESAMTTSQKIMTDSADRPSRDGSETDLMPPARERPQRISGPWSRAFALLDRR